MQTLEGPDGSPVTAKGDADGILRVKVEGGGAGDASEATQLLQLAAEQAIQAAVEAIDAKTPADPATVTSVDAVTAAVDALAGIAATDGSALTVNTSVIAVESAVNSVNAKLPALSTGPATNAEGMPVRQVPVFVPGKQLQTTFSAGVANTANKLLFGFTNNTGQTVCVTSVNLMNTQTDTISGAVAQMQLRRSDAAITGGTTLTDVSSPALVQGMSDPSFSIPSGFTWNTGGTLGGTIQTLGTCSWSTDELSGSGTGLANEIAARSVYAPAFDFSKDPLVVPNGYSLAVVCNASATNGATNADFNICFGS